MGSVGFLASVHGESAVFIMAMGEITGGGGLGFPQAIAHGQGAIAPAIGL